VALLVFRRGLTVLTNAHLALVTLYFTVPLILLFFPKDDWHKIKDMGFIAFMIVFLLWLPIVLWLWGRGR